jgi:hypothetical protein
LLVEHGLEHLDLHEVTMSRRVVTHMIAADLFDRGASAVRFPSRLDGGACGALFEGRGTVAATDDVVALTDPAPESLATVAAAWRLVAGARTRLRFPAVNSDAVARVTDTRSAIGHHSGVMSSSSTNTNPPASNVTAQRRAGSAKRWTPISTAWPTLSPKSSTTTPRTSAGVSGCTRTRVVSVTTPPAVDPAVDSLSLLMSISPSTHTWHRSEGCHVMNGGGEYVTQTSKI